MSSASYDWTLRTSIKRALFAKRGLASDECLIVIQGERFIRPGTLPTFRVLLRLKVLRLELGFPFFVISLLLFHGSSFPGFCESVFAVADERFVMVLPQPATFGVLLRLQIL